MGGPRELVAALRPAGAFDEAGLLQVKHDQLEIFGGDALSLGDPAELDRRTALLLRQEQQ